MPTITVDIDDGLKERMEVHSEVDWSGVSERAIRQRLETIERVGGATIDADTDGVNGAELADRIDEIAQRRIDEASD